MKSIALFVLTWISAAISAEVKTFPVFAVHDSGNGRAQLLVPAVSVGGAYSWGASPYVFDVVLSPVHLSWGCDWGSLYGVAGWRVVWGRGFPHGAVVGIGVEFLRHLDLGYLGGMSSDEFFHELRLAYSFGWKGNARRVPE